MTKQQTKSIVIIKHNGPGNYFAYDIFVKKDKKLCIKLGKNTYDQNSGYRINTCKYVEKFVTKNPKYEYLFSEDMGHIKGWNWIENFVDDLVLSNKATLIDKTV